MSFIVPENDPVFKPKPSYRVVRSWDALSKVLLDDHSYDKISGGRPITEMFYWNEHYLSDKEIYSDETKWGKWYNESSKPGFILPEEGKSYLRWLIKGELKDTFK